MHGCAYGGGWSSLSRRFEKESGSGSGVTGHLKLRVVEDWVEKDSGGTARHSIMRIVITKGGIACRRQSMSSHTYTE